MNAFMAFIASLFVVMWFSACATSDAPNTSSVSSQDELSTPVSCTVSSVRYPTTPDEMTNVYAGRSFYADGNHLGHDILLSEGAAIHPIACGVLRVYRPASGYGELAAVVEHSLATPLVVTNGMGEAVTITSFLSIYGHMRKRADRNGADLGLKPGDTVGPDDVLGYVNDDTHNGDGAEHLHLGIRLQSASDAQAVDASWFRGYDSNPSQRRWFAEPVSFMDTLTSNMTPVAWHPPGTVLRSATDGSVWIVTQDAGRQSISSETVTRERLLERAVEAPETELGCLEPADDYVSPRADKLVMKFADASTVYEYRLGQSAERHAFISYEAFRSWGWIDADVAVWPAAERDAFFTTAVDQGFRLMRDGSLVKAEGESEVSVVSEGRRLPIIDWSTFLSLGYTAAQIVTIPADTIEQVAGPKGPLITPEMVALCAHPSACVDNCPPPGNGGGTGDDVPDEPDDPDDPSPPETGVPSGKVHFRYDGPVLPGLNQFQGRWDPPGDVFHDWTPDTFALCPDTTEGDGILDCLLDMPSGTRDFLFTVHLPDGRWWGDMSCDPTGGCGQTIGTVTLENASGSISYELRSNGSGPDYKNGLVSLLP